MEVEPLILPDNTILDPTQPPPGFNFPRPDFTEIIQDHPSENDKTDLPLLKPTFKNILQAKKRLQAFSSTRPGPLPASPKKVKGSEEKAEETTPPVKKLPKKGIQERPKTLIEEIEELKREEQANIESRLSQKRSRSRSRSADKGRFKKVEKKSRNYRRGSINSPRKSPEKARKTPEKPRKSPKKTKRYPRNWREFYDFEADFDINRVFDVSAPTGNNEVLRQVVFESPSLPIVPFKMKTVNREEKVVPFPFIRYTRTKPVIPYSVNFGAIKDSCLSRKVILESLPKNIVANIEELYSNSVKFENFEVDVKLKKSMMWYPKDWTNTENECQVFEKSVGLSFLQNYTGEEEEENDFVEEKVHVEEEILEKDEKQKKKKKKKKEKIEEDEDVDKEEKLHKEDDKKKKKKMKKDEVDEEENVEKKKKKHVGKEKKKHLDDGSETVSKKRKHKKDKTQKKKDKREKEKKRKSKKIKEKKKKDKVQQEQQVEKPAEKLSKQQVIDELREIEEKLAKKREEEKEEARKKLEKEDKSRKRKHSDRENDAKTKRDKHRKTSDDHSPVKVEHHALKHKLEKAKKEPIRPKTEDREPKKADKHDDVKKEEHEKKKSRHSEERTTVRKRQSRWSEGKAELPDFSDLTIVEEIPHVDLNTSENIEDFDLEDMKIIEEIKENTPDTDEYHSLWESDDDVSASVSRQTLKMNRSWESDEELFERSHNKIKQPTDDYSSLEIPLNLNIKTISRRSNLVEKPISVIDELKLLEEERRSLSEERKKLELEKQKILKMQEEAKLELLDEKKMEPLPEVVKVKKEKSDDFSLDLNNSLSNVSSTESNFPIAVLENEYEEFIKAVSSESSLSVSSKKKTERRSSTSSSWSSDSDHKKKKRKAKMKKKKKKKKRECEGLLVGKGNDIFNEFDIPVPSDLPEMVPTPVPVPSPMLPLDNLLLPITAPNLLLNSMLDLHEKTIVEEPKPEIDIDLIKPFVFSSIVLPSKKTTLVDNSNLKLDEDSDSADFTDKFAKKPEENEEIKTNEEEIKPEETKIEEDTKPSDVKVEEKVEKIEEKKLPQPLEIVNVPLEPLDDIKNVPLPPEKAPPKSPPLVSPKPLESRPRRSRSVSPRKQLDRPKEKRRSRSRSRDRDCKQRRSPIRRRELTPPSRRRYSSPRRRSPPRRRGSPWRRSPSPRRRSSPPRRRRRSHSLSPLRRKKRSPSPRRRASPLNSPLDGFKRSVADSTISDDMLPAANPDEYSDSPSPYGGVVKFYERKKSPTGSPKRIPLDDRISLVLGLEKNEPPPPPPVQQTYTNYGYNNAYVQQYPQYQYPKNEYVPPFTGAVMYTQPPPPIVKPLPAPTKVVQVGNILQVVPTEEMPPPVAENKVFSSHFSQKIESDLLQTTERTQKIVQVGNMLQIVPAIMAVTKPPPPIPEPQPVAKPVQAPEIQSAETVMKKKIAERKAERDKRRQEREKRRKDKEKKKKEKDKRKQMKLKLKTENMIKRAIEIETEALANDLDEGEEPAEATVQWPPVPAVVATTSNGKGILLQGGAKQRKSVQFADGVRPGEGTSPSGGEELSSPPPHPRKLPKEKRYKKLKIPRKSKKRKVRVKVVKKVNVVNVEDDDDDSLPPPSPPPGSPPPHVFPSRVKTHTINNVRQFVGSIIQSGVGSIMQSGAGYPFRAPIPPPVLINRHQPPPGYLPATYPQDVSLSHQTYQGVSSHH